MGFTGQISGGRRGSHQGGWGDREGEGGFGGWSQTVEGCGGVQVEDLQEAEGVAAKSSNQSSGTRSGQHAQLEGHGAHGGHRGRRAGREGHHIPTTWGSGAEPPVSLKGASLRTESGDGRGGVLRGDLARIWGSGPGPDWPSLLNAR